MELIYLQPPYLQRYVDAVAGKGAPLYNCFDFVRGTITRWYIAATRGYKV